MNQQMFCPTPVLLITVHAEAKNEGVSDRDQGAAYQHTVSAITEQVQQMNLPSSTAPDAAAAPSQQDDDLHDWQHVQPPGVSPTTLHLM